MSHHLIHCKWEFKIKQNSVYRACLVAKGLSLITGVDFTENFSPVVNDITFHVVLAQMLIENLDAVVIDVETVLLYGKLEEEIFMEISQGYKEVFPAEGIYSIDSLLLKQALCGVAQAAGPLQPLLKPLVSSQSC